MQSLTKAEEQMPGIRDGKEVTSFIDDVGEFVLGPIRFRTVAFPVKKN